MPPFYRRAKREVNALPIFDFGFGIVDPTSHPPSVAATCLAAFEVLEEEPERIESLCANTRFFKEGLKKLGFNTGVSETPITPVIVCDAALAHQFSRELFAEGIFAMSVGFPTVPVGNARIRPIVTATYTTAELMRALNYPGRRWQEIEGYRVSR